MSVQSYLKRIGLSRGGTAYDRRNSAAGPGKSVVRAPYLYGGFVERQLEPDGALGSTQHGRRVGVRAAAMNEEERARRAQLFRGLAETGNISPGMLSALTVDNEILSGRSRGLAASEIRRERESARAQGLDLLANVLVGAEEREINIDLGRRTRAESKRSFKDAEHRQLLKQFGG